MIVPSFLQRGGDLIANTFRARAGLIPREVEREVKKNAELLRVKIQQRASGRPGPNVITGEYRSSWQVLRQGDGTYVVFSDAPQAARLEYGFAGVDALGRVYHQPPFPHVNPAADEIEGAFFEDLARVAVKGL